MATTEAKTEAKTETKTEAKDKEVEENQEHLKCKTWVLRVSIHCEGCKRKVKKILTNIDGVYTTKIDLRQHRVVVYGDVNAETLIKKLEKNGKHAELWPEKGEKKSKSKKKDKQQSDQEGNEEGKQEKETAKIEPEKDSAKNVDNGGGSGKNDSDCVHVKFVNEGGATSKAGGQVKDSKTEAKQTVIVQPGCQSPVGEKKVGWESEGGAEKSGGGSGSGGKKKKKKKGQKGNNDNAGEGETSGDAPAGTGLPNHGHGPHGQGPFPSPASCSSPIHHVYQYPPHYSAPPVYAVSYNTAYPTTSYSTSYYAAPTPNSYTYVHPGIIIEPPSSDSDSHPSQPTDSFTIFSDENPNACSIM